MNKIIAATAFMLLGGTALKASNYPNEYTYQTARVVSAGPAVVASVSSGIMRKLVIGYKRSGVLGNSDSISAVARTSYSDSNGSVRTVERVIKMPKEMHGTGFMSEAMEPYELVDDNNLKEIVRIELAFSNGPKWDSDYGANYVVKKGDFDRNAATFRSEHSSPPNIDQHCWDFIVGQMRK